MPDDALSASNPKIKRLRRLDGRRSSRLEEGAFVIEGPLLVDEAIAAGVELEAIYVDEREPRFREHFAGRGVELFDVAKGVLSNVLPSVYPPGLCATAPSNIDRTLEDVVVGATKRDRPLLVLVDVADPGNAGTLLRAAEASGAAGVVFAGRAVDAYNPKVVRSSAGSLFRVPIAIAPDTSAALESIAELGVTTAATVARDGVAHLDAPLTGCVAIVVGNEAHGLAADVVDACDATVTITMDGPAESLNVAMAGTVLCFEALRQRGK